MAEAALCPRFGSTSRCACNTWRSTTSHLVGWSRRWPSVKSHAAKPSPGMAGVTTRTRPRHRPIAHPTPTLQYTVFFVIVALRDTARSSHHLLLPFTTTVYCYYDPWRDRTITAASCTWSASRISRWLRVTPTVAQPARRGPQTVMSLTRPAWRKEAPRALEPSMARIPRRRRGECTESAGARIGLPQSFGGAGGENVGVGGDGGGARQGGDGAAGDRATACDGGAEGRVRGGPRIGESLAGPPPPNTRSPRERRGCERGAGARPWGLLLWPLAGLRSPARKEDILLLRAVTPPVRPPR